ncbi:MAG: response regulator [Candidatus Latescibacteria bacterium]|nr:response regulator [Candidatus Latescibacterota bacterium]
MTIRLILVDDHPMLRQGLRALLDQETDLQVVAEAGDGRTAVQQAQTQQPDLVIMDLALPQLNGIEATRQIRALYPQIKIIALSQHMDSRYVEGALEAGADGYVLKRAAVGELVQAVRVVTAGQAFLSPFITRVVLDRYSQPADRSLRGLASPLTDREREILQLITEGQTTSQIALNLHLSERTVSTHRQHIMDKLGLHTLPALTKYALREGLTSFDL